MINRLPLRQPEVEDETPPAQDPAADGSSRADGRHATSLQAVGRGLERLFVASSPCFQKLPAACTQESIPSVFTPNLPFVLSEIALLPAAWQPTPASAGSR